MQKIKMVVMGLVMTVAAAFVVAQPSFATVTCPVGSLRSGTAETLADCNVAEEEDTLMSTVFNGIRIALGVLGLVAAIIIIAGGVQYMASAGDAAKITKARNTILYAVVGLVIAILAFAIVSFILDNILG